MKRCIPVRPGLSCDQTRSAFPLKEKPIRIARTLLLGSALVAFGSACADLPTARPEDAKPSAQVSAASTTLGEIYVAAV
jgi:hypothetical protein